MEWKLLHPSGNSPGFRSCPSLRSHGGLRGPVAGTREEVPKAQRQNHRPSYQPWVRARGAAPGTRGRAGHSSSRQDCSAGDSSSPGVPSAGSTPRVAQEEVLGGSVGQSGVTSPAAWLPGPQLRPHSLRPALRTLLQPVCAVDGKRDRTPGAWREAPCHTRTAPGAQPVLGTLALTEAHRAGPADQHCDPRCR